MNNKVAARRILLICAFLASTDLSAQANKGDRNLVISPPTASVATTTSQRVALVIGNGAYKDAPLTNPPNDARAIAQALKENGFTVTLKENTDIKGMLASIRDFGEQLRKGGVGLFYYAGHGMQIKGRNYLVPIGGNIEREDEVAYASVDAQAVLDKMDAAGNGTNIMILDACRNNPFARSFRSAQQGLAQMDAPAGTLVAFATSPGAVASDGNGKHGLYTQHLLEVLQEPNLKVEEVFKKVRSAVRRDSQGRQVPWEATSLEGDFYFKPPNAATETADSALERSMWFLVKDTRQSLDIKAFMARFPNSAYAADARAKIAQLEPAGKPPVVTTIQSFSKPELQTVAVPNAPPSPSPSSGSALTTTNSLGFPTKDSNQSFDLKAFLARFPIFKNSADAQTKIVKLDPPGKPPVVDTAQSLARPEMQAVTAPRISSNSSALPGSAAIVTNAYGLHVGDRWNFQVVDKYKGEVVSNWSRKVTAILPNGDWTSDNAVFSAEGNMRSQSDDKFGNRTYTTANLLIPKKMETGYVEDVVFSEKSKRENGEPFEQEFKGTVTVKGQETVKVPAGEFLAYRIERNATVHVTKWIFDKRLNAREEITYWYVPAIHNFVALEATWRPFKGAPDRTRTELTSYEVQKTKVANN